MLLKERAGCPRLSFARATDMQESDPSEKTVDPACLKARGQNGH